MSVQKVVVDMCMLTDTHTNQEAVAGEGDALEHPDGDCDRLLADMSRDDHVTVNDRETMIVGQA